MESWSLYRPAAPALQALGVSCLGAGEQEGRLPSFSGRRLSTHALVIVNQGTGWLRYAGNTYPVHAPAMIWIFPGADHGYGPGPGWWREHWVLFTGAGVRAFEELGCLNRERPLVTLTETDPDLTAPFAPLRSALRVEGPLGDLEASVHTQQIIVNAGRYGVARSSSSSETVLAGLRELAYKPLGLAEQADQLGLSSSQLRRTVKAAAGVGPKEFVLQVRMSRAQSLLADSDFSIDRTARLVGYDDPAYFSRLFSQRTGLSPSQFRQQHHRGGSQNQAAVLTAPDC